MKDVMRLKLVLSACSRSLLCFAIFCLSLLLLYASHANAQSTGGRIRGTVTDASGGAVAGAKVTLVNEATNTTRDTVTSGTGEYFFLEVPVGSYEVDINQPGFKKYARKGIALNLNEVLTVDIPLQVGGSTETVEVTGEPPVVDTTTTQLGAVVNERSSTQLPLNQRDVYQLLQLQPGVQSQLGNDTFYGSDKAGVVTVNGGRGRSNNYSVNGGDGNDLFANLPAIEPSPDSIEEFRVITNAFDAEYGRNSGAVVNVVTKSGTNVIHGSAYEFFRNDVLNAHPFTFTESPKPDFKQNQFGGTLGGPIKKDKTFIFGSYEGRRIVQGIVSQQEILPTPDELAGNFGAGQAFAGNLTDSIVAGMLQDRCGANASPTLPPGQKLSSAAQALVAGVVSGGAPVPYTQIFPNNQIPTGCFDPVALSLLSYVPGGTTGSNQPVITVPNKTDRGDQFQIRVDHSLNVNQKLAIYYYFDDDDTVDPFAKFQAAGDPLGGFPGEFATRTQQINGTHTWTIGATAVNEFRFSYFREGQEKFNAPTRTNAITASCGTGTASQYCFNGVSDTPTLNNACAAGAANTVDCGIHTGLGASKEGVPYISVVGGMTIGNNFEGQLPQTGNTYQWSDNYSKIVGNHSFKFGGDLRYQQFNQFLYYNVNGSITFNSSPTLPTGDDLGYSDSYANYLLGLANSYSQGSAQQELVRSTSAYLFAQDSWKLKPNLTLNYGLRWELNTPITDIGHKVQTFRPGQRSTIYPCSLDPTNPLYATFGGGEAGCDAAGVTPVGLVFPGDKGVPAALTNTYYKGFAPRIGLAWSPEGRDGLMKTLFGGPGKTSISAGYGMFYNPIEQLVLEQFSAEPPFGGSNFITAPFLQTPFIDQTGTVYSNPFNGVLNPPRGTPLDWSNFQSSIYFGQFPANLRPQYSDQYNLTIKRELPGNVLVQVGYVGSQGHRLLASYELNPGNPTTCNDLNNIVGPNTCGPFGEDSAYSFNLPPGATIHLPYAPPSSPGTPNTPCPIVGNIPAACILTNNTSSAIPVTLVGIRQYSSPLCNPLTGVDCPANSTPVFSSIFTENTIAKSNYNSLQALVEKRFSHGLQFQASYTYSKSMDNASSFESALNPLNFDSTYGLSAYDARHRFVFNYVWDLPVPKMDGVRGVLLNGWEVSGILTFQSGFPIRVTSQDDIEQLDSAYLFEAPGEPNWAFDPGQLHKLNIRQSGGFVFDPNQFTNTTVAPGTIGDAPRSLCCGPGINNTDMSFSKMTGLTERLNMEFRADIFNIWNHAQFYSVDGNVSDQGGTFGQVLHIRDPRLIQFALKFKF